MPPDAPPHDEPLRFAVVELTNRCNLRCPHCASGSGRARPDELDADEWAALFDDLARLGCEEVTLLGGEIFLRPDWEEIARSALDRGLGTTVVTNGLLLQGERLEQLRSLPLERLGVSLDGATPAAYRAVRGVDGFERVWRLLRQLRQEDRVPVSAITTFSRANLGEVEPLAELLSGSGVTWQVQIAGRVSTRFHRDQFLGRDEYRRLCRRLGEHSRSPALELVMMDDMGYFPLDPAEAELYDWWTGCEAGRTVIGVRANGDLLGCLSLGDEFVEANLRQRPLRELWRDRDSFARLRRRGERLGGACQSCPEAARCRAGCTAMAFSATGDIADNPYCLRRLDCEEVLASMEI